MDFDTVGRNELIGKLLLSCKYDAVVREDVINDRPA